MVRRDSCLAALTCSRLAMACSRLEACDGMLRLKMTCAIPGWRGLPACSMSATACSITNTWVGESMKPYAGMFDTHTSFLSLMLGTIVWHEITAVLLAKFLRRNTSCSLPHYDVLPHPQGSSTHRPRSASDEIGAGRRERVFPKTVGW